MSENKCFSHVEYKSSFGPPSYHACPHKVVAEVTFKQNNGILTTRDVCKTHLNGLVKTKERLFKRNGHDTELKIKYY